MRRRIAQASQVKRLNCDPRKKRCVSKDEVTRWPGSRVCLLPALAEMAATLFLATTSGVLQRNLRGIACAAGKFTTSATRPDFAVHHEAIVPDAVSSSTPLPAVLTTIDPQRFPTLSQARKSLRRGFVLINGVRSGCGSTASPGDVVALQERVAVGAAQQRGTAPFALDIVYEDGSLGIVVKPAGVCTHPPKDGDDRRRIGADGGNTMRTAVGFALRPPAVGTRQVLYRPHVCHRLDRLTSGLLLCAKTYPALVALRRGFAERTIHKEYRAVVGGSVDGDEGTIDAPLLDSRGEWVSAVTQWRVLSRARSDALPGGDLTELALWPKTGRTHQLRRHAAEILKAPIVGDTKYGGADAGAGLFLAAIGLRFPHPEREAEEVRVAIDPPPQFEELLRPET